LLHPVILNVEGFRQLEAGIKVCNDLLLNLSHLILADKRAGYARFRVEMILQAAIGLNQVDEFVLISVFLESVCQYVIDGLQSEFFANVLIKESASLVPCERGVGDAICRDHEHIRNEVVYLLFFG
jgi:hypothetical protein